MTRGLAAAVVLALAAILGLVVAPATADEAQPGLVLSQARARFITGGVEREEAVTLPYHWDAHHPGRRGSAVFTLSFELAQGADDAWAMEAARLGNAYEIRLNGVLVDRRGDLAQHDGADYGHLPRFVPLAGHLLRASNVLEIGIRADLGRRSGLSTVVIGRHDLMRADYEARAFRIATGTAIVSAFSLGVGLLALGLWMASVRLHEDLATRRDVATYGWAALALLVGSFSAAYPLVTWPPVPWPWWGVLWTASVGLWIGAMMRLHVGLVGGVPLPGARGFGIAVGALVATGPLAAAGALSLGWRAGLSAWYVAMALACLVFCAAFILRVVRTRSRDGMVACVALVANLAAGARDLYLFRFTADGDQVLSIRYASVMFGLTLGYLVIARFRQAGIRGRELARGLASTVDERERELRATYERMAELARRDARTAERGHILRDMHDGVGAHLSMAIRQVESGVTSREELLPTLRDSLDQLKLTIDTMNLPRGEVGGLLANLRYRLGPRIEAAGIELDWQVELIEPVEQLDAAAIRQLMFILFEAISNVLQHSRARRLAITASDTGSRVRVCLVDDGVGFDASARGNHGLHAMHERAAALGFGLAIRSEPGCTRVELTIPRTPA